MAVLVTGALGHIGARVCAQLIENGDAVVAFDRDDAAGRLPVQLRRNSRLVCERGSVTDAQAVDDLFSRHAESIDGVIHIAGIGGVPEFVERPAGFLELNVMGTVNVLEAARKHKIDRFTFVSSGAVYGTRDGVLRETDPAEPSDLYGASKLAGEQIVLRYGDAFGFHTSCARVFFVYGPGRRPAGMWPVYRWIFGPLDGLTNIVTDEGADQLIDFTHVFDTAQGIIAVHRHASPKSRIYNISSGNAVRLGDAVEMVKVELGRDTGVRLGPGRALQRGSPLDISRAAGELDYVPRFARLSDGIHHYHQWLISNPGETI